MADRKRAKARKITVGKIVRIISLVMIPGGKSSEERAREKQASREEDARALASGEKSQEDFRRENGAIGLVKCRVRLAKAARLY